MPLVVYMTTTNILCMAGCIHIKSQSLLSECVLSQASEIRWHCMYYCCHQPTCDKSIQRENGKEENEESGEEDGEQSGVGCKRKKDDEIC